MVTVWYPSTIEHAYTILINKSIPVEKPDDSFVEFYSNPTPGYGWQKEISLGLIWTGDTSAHHKTDMKLDDDVLWNVCLSDAEDPRPGQNTVPRIYKTGSTDLRVAGIVYTRIPREMSLLLRIKFMRIHRLIRAQPAIYVYPPNWSPR